MTATAEGESPLIDPDAYYPFEFEAEIVHHALGTYRYTVVFLDDRLIEHLPLVEHPRLRMSGELRDIPFEGAWQPVRGRWYVMLSKAVLRQGPFEVGDRVIVRFRVEEQDRVKVPDELERVLKGSDELRSLWDDLSVGKRRGLAHSVATAKTAATRAKRIAKVVDQLRGAADR